MVFGLKSKDKKEGKKPLKTEVPAVVEHIERAPDPIIEKVVEKKDVKLYCPRCNNPLTYLKFGEYRCDNDKCQSQYSGFPPPR